MSGNLAMLSKYEAMIIDKLCAALSDESAAVMLEIAEGITAVGWDESGGVARARRALQERLGGDHVQRVRV
jgi:hypothetical protein